MERRVQLDAAALGPLTLTTDNFSIDHKVGYDTYSVAPGGVTTVEFTSGEALLQLVGSLSFDLYPNGSSAPGGDSFTLGSDARIDAFSTTTTRPVSAGAVTFLVDDLVEPTDGVALPNNSALLPVDGSSFTANHIQLVAESSSNETLGPQVLLQGFMTFSDAVGFSPTITGKNYVTVGPHSGILLNGFDSTVGQTNFTAKGMDFQAVQPVIDHQSGTEAWTVTGELSFSTSSKDKQGNSKTQFAFSGTLGYSVDNLPGLVFNAGKLTDFAMTLDVGVGVGVGLKVTDAGLHILTGNPNKPVKVSPDRTREVDFAIIYLKATETHPAQFIAIGKAGYQSEAKPGVPFAPGFSLDFGDIDQGAPGLTIQDGTFTQFAVGVTTAFGLGPVQIELRDFGLEINEGKPGVSDDTLSFYGEIGVYLKSSWAGATVQFGTSAADPGLVVDLSTGQIQLEDIAFDIQYIPLGAFIIQDAGFEYRATENGDFDIDVHAELLLSAGWAVGVDFQFDKEGLKEITGLFAAVSGNPGIEIGDTGLALNEIELSILNIDNPTDLAVQANATFVYGDAFTIAGYEVAPFVAVGSIYDDKNRLDLDGTVYLVAYSTPGTTADPAGLTRRVWTSLIGGPAEASIDLDWSAGKYSLSVSNLPVYSSMTVSGSMTFDDRGDFVLSAEADLVVPSVVPLIGGRHLASLDFLFAYDNAIKSGFADAWADIDLIFKHVKGGFEFAFAPYGAVTFSLIGSKTIGKLQAQADSYINQSANDTPRFTYSKDTSVDVGTGTSGLTHQVVFPTTTGQAVFLTLPEGLEIDLGATDVGTLRTMGIAVVPCDDSTTRIVHIVGSPDDPAVALAAGTYTFKLSSPVNFDQEDVQFNSLLDFVPPTVATTLTGDGTVASTLALPLLGSVAGGLVGGLKSQVKVRYLVDDDAVGYDGRQAGSAMVNLNDDGTWATSVPIDLNGLPPSRIVRVYAAVDDGTNHVVFSEYSGSVTTNPLFFGSIVNTRADGVTVPGGIPGVLVYLDLNPQPSVIRG